MPGGERPLGGIEIRSHLAEVAAELAEAGAQHVVTIVGGALLAWRQLRDTTHDVDSIRRLEPELRDAVARVARRHDLDVDWLNDHAAGFRPSTFRDDACSVLLDHPRLLVQGAPLDQVFLMKLYRVQAQDYEDMVRIWPLTGFGSPHEAAAQFAAAYPHAPEDEHLVEMIRDIAAEAADRP